MAVNELLFPAERPHGSLREWAYRQLRAMIVSGALVPGADINEGQLCAKLGISKSPLREALGQLAQEGLVVATSRRGAHVAELSGGDWDEIYSLRAYIEALEVRLVAERATPTQIAELRANIVAMDRCGRAGDPTGFAARDAEFHLMLARMSGHRRLWRLQESLQAEIQRMVRYRMRFLGRDGEEETVERHSSIVDALEAGQADLAEERMRAHIRRGQEFRVASWRPPKG